MRTGLLLASALALFPTLTLAGPHDGDRAQNRRMHFATGIRRAHFVQRGFYCFNGVNWVFAPVAYPYGELAVNGDFVYRGQEVFNDVILTQYRHPIPTS